MCTKELKYEGDSICSYLTLNPNKKVMLPGDYSDLQPILDMLLVLNPAKRSTIDKVLNY